MSEMIERVALAIEQARARGEAYGGRKLARIAIAAMREPTEKMVGAAMNFGWQPSPPNIGYDDAWRAMIDAALAE